MKKAGITNAVVGALDAASAVAMLEHGIPCFKLDFEEKDASSGPGAAELGTARYNRVVWTKANVAWRVLAAGFNVVVSSRPCTPKSAKGELDRLIGWGG